MNMKVRKTNEGEGIFIRLYQKSGATADFNELWDAF